MMLVSTIVVALSGLLTLPFGWVALGWAELGLFSLTALLVFVAQSLMIESLRHREVGLVRPFKYTSYVWAVLFGAAVWGDIPDPWAGGVSAGVIAHGA